MYPVDKLPSGCVGEGDLTAEGPAGRFWSEKNVLSTVVMAPLHLSKKTNPTVLQYM